MTRALAEPSQVGSDAPRAVEQPAHLWRPERPVVREAVNERDRNPAADVIVRDLDTVAECDHERSSIGVVRHLHPPRVERHPEQGRQRLLGRDVQRDPEGLRTVGRIEPPSRQRVEHDGGVLRRRVRPRVRASIQLV